MFDPNLFEVTVFRPLINFAFNVILNNLVVTATKPENCQVGVPRDTVTRSTKIKYIGYYFRRKNFRIQKTSRVSCKKSLKFLLSILIIYRLLKDIHYA